MDSALMVAGMTAAVLCGCLLPIVIAILRKKAVLDLPTARSSHTVPTPRGAGIAIGLALTCVVAGAAIWDPTLPHLSVAALLGIAMVFMVGLFDDFLSLPAGPRMVATFASAAVAIWPVVPLALVPVAAFFVTGFTNAYNFMDGINGISALTTVVTMCWYCGVLLSYDVGGWPLIAAALVGCSVAFLPFNIPRAAIFLGDSGSYLLGFVTGLLAVVCYSGGVPIITAVAPLVIYVSDTALTIVKRLARGERLTQPHREHVYQRLAALGISHWVVSIFVTVLVVACQAASLLPTPFALVAFVLVVYSYFAAPTVFARVLPGVQ